ncbi:hypothetical protein ACFLXY_03605 [Chloroflexota bacterium]
MSETKSEIINILLAIQQEFLCNGVKAIFSPYDEIHIVGELDNFENITDSVKAQLPDIVVISTGERNPFVFDCVKTIKASYPEVSVIIMLENIEDELIYTALGLGVSACVTTGVHAGELITCIRKVSHGEYPIIDTLLIPEIARLIIKDMDSYLSNDNIKATDAKKTLSNEEGEILRLVAGGYTYDQLISSDNNSENDVMLHLTDIYGKLVFNNYLQLSAQPSDKSITHDQSINENPVEDNTNTQTINHATPEQNSKREDNINVNDIHSEYTSSVWDGFEVLKKELQETLEKLAPVDDHPLNLIEEEHVELSGNIEEDITKIEDTDEPSSDVMKEPHGQKVDDFDITIDSSTSIPHAEEVHEESSSIDKEDTGTIENTDEPLSDIMTELYSQKVDDFDKIDQEHGSPSDDIPEEMLPIREDEIKNPESQTNNFVVNTAEESDKVPQDTLGTTKELEVKEYDKPIKQKSRWFRFSLKRDNKIDVKNNKSSKNDNRPKNTSISDKLELDIVKEPDLTKDEKKIPKRVNRDGKDTTQIDHKYSQGEILSSVKGLGVPVFIQTPVDRKQLEKLESIINNTDDINIILHKGTAQEHILVVSGQDSPDLLKTLSNIPLVESTSDENGTINIKLLPMTDMDYIS